MSAEVSMAKEGHRAWVRVCHWVVAISFLVLCFSGIYIFAVHPRLYWGEVGNSLTPALLEIPITANHRPEGWERTATFPIRDGDVFTASRTYAIFNQNGWARSLHFLAAWLGVAVTLVYCLIGAASGHVWRNLVPRVGHFAPGTLMQDAKAHLSARNIGVGPPYGHVQKVCYAGTVFFALPLMLVTGLTMSPAVTAAMPLLLDAFGGYQSARSIHFLGFVALVLFIVVHVAMVVATGFGRQMRAMLWEKKNASR